MNITSGYFISGLIWRKSALLIYANVPTATQERVNTTGLKSPTESICGVGPWLVARSLGYWTPALLEIWHFNTRGCLFPYMISPQKNLGLLSVKQAFLSFTQNVASECILCDPSVCGYVVGVGVKEEIGNLGLDSSRQPKPSVPLVDFVNKI